MASSTATDEKSTDGLRLVDKLLARAFDPAARDGEAENAAGKAVLVCRRNGIGLPRLAEHLARECKVLPPPTPAAPASTRPDALDVRMPFGKHRGETLADIARRDPGYLRWMAAELDDAFLAECASEVLDWFAEGGGR
jgi:hypothetical protein